MHADLLLANATFYTLDAAQPRPEALAIAGGRIAAAGSRAEMRALLAPGGREVDLGGGVVLPGFIDAHLHLLSYGQTLREIDLVAIPSVEAALERVAARAATAPPGQWLSGRGWEQSIWPGGAFPSRADLDRVAPDHPVFLRRKCGHAGWANSRALELAGIRADTPDPAGGEIHRDPATGRPTGILTENAMNLVGGLIALPDLEGAMAAIRAATAHLHRMGVVGVHNMEAALSLAAYQELRRTGMLGLRVLEQIPEAELDAAIALGLRSGFGDEWIRIGGVKIFSDGSLGARSALMVAPYEGEPDNTGIAVATAEHLARQVDKAARAGLAVFIHAIGDQANRNVLDAVEATRHAGVGLHLRHRIEHAQVLQPGDLPRFAGLGVIASMQPIHCTQDMFIADAHWGPRCRTAYAWSSLQSSGAALAFGSDAPVETPSVLEGLYAAVTRRRPDGAPGPDGWYPEECVTVEEAVRAYTLGAAYAAGEEESKGSLTPGKLADLVVLDRDILHVAPEEMREAEVTATMVDGAFVFQK